MDKRTISCSSGRHRCLEENIQVEIRIPVKYSVTGRRRHAAAGRGCREGLTGCPSPTARLSGRSSRLVLRRQFTNGACRPLFLSACCSFASRRHRFSAFLLNTRSNRSSEVFAENVLYLVEKERIDAIRTCARATTTLQIG